MIRPPVDERVKQLQQTDDKSFEKNFIGLAVLAEYVLQGKEEFPGRRVP